MYEDKLYQKTLQTIENSRDQGMLTAHSTTRAVVPFIKKLCKQFSLFYSTRRHLGINESKETAFSIFIKDIL